MEKQSITEKATFLCFKLAKEVFAINVYNVIEVLLKKDLTPIPKTADYIIGIVNFRDEMLPVVSARMKLNITNSSENKEEIIIIVEFDTGNIHSKLGIIADKVIGVLTVNVSEIKPVLEFGNYYNPEFLKGVFKYNEEIVTILDIEKIFSQDEIKIINESNKQ